MLFSTYHDLVPLNLVYFVLENGNFVPENGNFVPENGNFVPEKSWKIIFPWL